jgi:DNA-binding SARP family transcriptional activator
MRGVEILGRLRTVPETTLCASSRRLFAYLALRNEPVPRVVVSSALWADLPEPQGRANLRRALWQSPPGWIVTTGDELSLAATVDLPAARAVALRALGGGALEFDEIALLSNDILPGWYDEWVRPAQDSFRLLRVQAMEAACRTMTEAGKFALATQAGTAALSADPLRESAAAALIEAHLREGNRYAAACLFADFARNLRAELGVPPDPTLAAALAAAGAVHPAGDPDEPARSGSVLAASRPVRLVLGGDDRLGRRSR